MANYKITDYTGTEVISRDEAKEYLRVDFDSDDSYIDQLIKMARLKVTHDTHCPVVETEVTEYFKDFPSTKNSIQKLQFSGTIKAGADYSVIKYFDTLSTTQTLTYGTDYIFASFQGLGKVQFINTFDVAEKEDALSIKYKISPANENQLVLKIAMLMLIQHYYDNRSPVSYLRVDEMPLGYKNLINQFKNYIW